MRASESAAATVPRSKQHVDGGGVGPDTRARTVREYVVRRMESGLLAGVIRTEIEGRLHRLESLVTNLLETPPCHAASLIPQSLPTTIFPNPFAAHCDDFDIHVVGEAICGASLLKPRALWSRHLCLFLRAPGTLHALPHLSVDLLAEEITLLASHARKRVLLPPRPLGHDWVYSWRFAAS